MTFEHVTKTQAPAKMNRILDEDRPVHDWYRFVLSFPPHLVRQYLNEFEITPRDVVLDPFCGTGTTLVECKKRGVPSVGVEANPIAHLASTVKVDWSPEPRALLEHAELIAETTRARLRAQGIIDDPFMAEPVTGTPPLRGLPPEQMHLLLKNSISPLPLHKTLVLLEVLRENAAPRLDGHERLALARALVTDIGNLRFGPEVGVGKVKVDSPVITPWIEYVRRMAADLENRHRGRDVPARALCCDARSGLSELEPRSISAVITSPPYPNEKDYTRTTRLESVLLGLLKDLSDLRAVKRNLLRSNTRGVYKGDDDDRHVEDNPVIQRIAEDIEKRRVSLGKTSGFERLYARVAKLYFGGMARHFAQLQRALRPGAHLAYVVGDQASYLRVMIRTGRILGDIAQSLGYELVGIKPFRTRFATATRKQMREEVVVLRWPRA